MLTRFLTALLLALPPISGIAAATDGLDTISNLLRDYQLETGVPVADLDRRSLTRLANGETLQRKVKVTRSIAGDDDTTTVRIIGYRLIDKPRERLWLAALAFDGGFSERLTEHLVRTHNDGGASWYQHVDMPWPLRDRHWLIRTGKGVALARRMDNRIWEHHWRLEPDAKSRIAGLLGQTEIPGLDPNRASKAVQLPLNNGAWVMATLDDARTLVVVHATMDMGGVVPDVLVNRYTKKQLQSMLERIEAQADTAMEQYDSEYIIYRGDGTAIAPSAAAAATRPAEESS